MDPVIIASLITAGGSIGGAIYQTVRLNKSRKQLEGAETAIIEPGIRIDAAYTIGEYRIETVFNKDGHGEVVKNWVGVQANQAFQNLRISFMAVAEAPDGVEMQRPVVEEDRQSPLPVSFAPEGQELYRRRSMGFIVVQGQFDQDTSPVGFKLTQPFRAAFCVTREQAESAYGGAVWKKEYSGARIDVPTDLLIVSVEFPESHADLRPGPSPVVFWADTEAVHMQETNRLSNEKCFDYSNGIASLRVEGPALGLRYAITWMPPRA